MGLIRTAEPATEPLSLTEAKLHLKQQDLDDDDALITPLIKAVRAAVEDYTQRALVTQTWQLTIDYGWPTVEERGYCRSRIVLPRPPLASVGFVRYVDVDGTTQTLSASAYRVFKMDTGLWAIEPAYAVIWPSVRCQPAAITVELTSGSAAADVPPTLVAAMKLWLAHLYVNRESVNVGNIVNMMPMSAQMLLDMNRVFPGG